MHLLFFVLSFAAQCVPTRGQVYFEQPTAGEVVTAGMPFIVRPYDSVTAPYFSQMDQFDLLLLSGNETAPLDIFSWYLNDTDPSTVSNSVIIPPEAGPNAADSYFMAIRGSLSSNSSIYVTYYSDRFTLTNMTGALTPDFASANELLPTTYAAGMNRLINCGSPTGISCNPTELAVLSSATHTYAQLSLGRLIVPAVTSPPAISNTFSTTATGTGITASSAANSSIQITATATSIASSTNSPVASGAGSGKIPDMAYMIIITGISLTAVCVLFYIYSRYRRSRHCPKRDCEKFAQGGPRERRWWERMSMPGFVGMGGEAAKRMELQSAHRRVEMNAERARRQELDVRGRGRGEAKFELEGEGEIAKPKEVPRIVVIGKSKARDESGRTVIRKMEKVALPPLPPLPKDQGPPCGMTEEVMRIREEEGQRLGNVVRVTGGV